MFRYGLTGFLVLMPLWQAAASETFRPKLSVEVMQSSDDIYRYSYTLTNAAGSKLPVAELLINISPDADLQEINPPTGWGKTDAKAFLATLEKNDPAGAEQFKKANRDGPGEFIDFGSSDGSVDIHAGESRNFTIASKLAPGKVKYMITGYDAATHVIDTSIGEIDAPMVPYSGNAPHMPVDASKSDKTIGGLLAPADADGQGGKPSPEPAAQPVPATQSWPSDRRGNNAFPNALPSEKPQSDMPAASSAEPPADAKEDVKTQE